MSLFLEPPISLKRLLFCSYVGGHASSKELSPHLIAPNCTNLPIVIPVI